jgi:hypothetical protein
VEIKAIETVYRGYRFRSRLEARWAVFFDTLDMKWRYETEGLNLDGIWYLPDFWLPDFFNGSYLEVKPDMPNADELKKLFALHEYHNVFVAVADPMTRQGLFCVLRDSLYFLRFAYKEATRQLCLLDEDPKEAWLLCNTFLKEETFANKSWSVELTNNLVLMNAYTTARQARFEHRGT